MTSATVSLVDLQGAEVWRKEVTNTDHLWVGRENLSSGVYIVRVTSDRYPAMQRRVVFH